MTFRKENWIQAEFNSLTFNFQKKKKKHLALFSLVIKEIIPVFMGYSQTK